MANLMKQTEERHSESRMRAIRTSGSMRVSPSGGQWPSRLSSRLGLPTLLKNIFPGETTKNASSITFAHPQHGGKNRKIFALRKLT
jgi:hypothetical protein